jgi:hypothetical protein
MISRCFMNRPNTAPHSCGAYAPDAFLQWWYFDAVLENGLHFMTFFLPRFAGSVDGREPGLPMMEAVVREKSGKTIQERRFFRQEELQASPEKTETRFGDRCSIAFHKGGRGQELGQYRLRGETERIRYDLTLDPELPPWAPAGAGGNVPRALMVMLRRSLFTTDSAHYVPLVPRGTLRGTIAVDGEAVSVRGSGYCEQGRLNFPLGRFVPAWYWLHVEHPPWTLLSGTVDPPAWVARFRPGTVGGFARVQKGERCLLSAFDFTGLAVRWHGIRKRAPKASGEQSMAWEAGVRLQRPGLRVTAELVSRDLLVFVPFGYREEAAGSPYWGQTVADVSVEVQEGGTRTRFQCEGILETMVTGAR